MLQTGGFTYGGMYINKDVTQSCLALLGPAIFRWTSLINNTWVMISAHSSCVLASSLSLSKARNGDHKHGCPCGRPTLTPHHTLPNVTQIRPQSTVFGAANAPVGPQINRWCRGLAELLVESYCIEINVPLRRLSSFLICQWIARLERSIEYSIWTTSNHKIFQWCIMEVTPNWEDFLYTLMVLYVSNNLYSNGTLHERFPSTNDSNVRLACFYGSLTWTQW